MSRLALALGLALLAVEVAMTVAIITTSEHVSEELGIVWLALGAGVVFALAGLVAIWRRPENRTGVFMAAVGYIWLLGSIGESDVAWLYSAGFVAGGLAFVPFAALLLAYPTGEFEARFDRVFPLVVGATILSLSLALVLVDPSPDPTCERCPENVLAVVDVSGLADVLRTLATLNAILLSTVGGGLLVRRWRRATPPLRRLLLPVFVTGGVALVALVLDGVVAQLEAGGSSVIAAVFFVAFGAVPIAFLFGILRTRLARSSVTDVVVALERGIPLRDALAAALGDPTVEVAFRLDPDRGLGGAGWVDPLGRSVPEPAPSRTRTVRFVQRDGERIAALSCDASLMHEPELVEAVAAAAGLALSNERLQAELRAEIRLAGTLADTAPALLSNVDTSGRIVKLNPATLRASGYSDESEVLGRYFWDIFIDDGEREEMQARFAAAAPEFPPAEYENAFTNARGERLVIYWRAAPVPDEEGRVVSIVAGGLDVTERRRREEEARAGEERLRAVIENAPVAIVEIDLDDRVLQWNPAAERIFGWSADEVLGEKTPPVPPGREHESREILRENRSNRLLTGLETARLRRDGSLVDVELSAAPIRDASGAVVGHMAVFSDITERRLRAQEAERQRDFMRALTEAIPSFLVAVDPDAIVVPRGINRAFTEAFGWTEDESEGNSFLEVISREDNHAARIAIANAANGVPQAERESRWLGKDGSTLLVAWTARPVMDFEGRSVVLVSGVDVTERRQRESEIRAERDFLNTIANSIPSMLTLLDDQGGVNWRGLNRAFREILGYEDADVVGRPLAEVVTPPEGRGEFEAALRAAIASGDVAGGESRWRARNGRIRLVEWTVVPTVNAEGRQRWLISATDITDRKRQEEELRASRGRIVEAADDARRKLERNLHDGAQQRLVALSVSLRLAESKLGHDPAGAASLLTGAREELALALEELRELARGIHPAVLTDRGLGPALEALVSRMPITVKLGKPAERLAPAVEAAAYYVVAEALTNVTKYARASAAEVSVSRNGDKIDVVVTDDGVGGADPEAGSGLRGLADRLAALDGVLRVESRAGEGTRVHAEIPLPDAEL